MCLQIHFAFITIEHMHILQETYKDSEHNRFLDCTKPISSLLAYPNAMLTGLSECDVHRSSSKPMSPHITLLSPSH